MGTIITLKSVTNADDARAIAPVAKPEELKLSELRQKIGAWMSPADAFLTALKVPVDPASEPEWSAADLWETGKPGTVLIRRATAPAATSITVRSIADADDARAIAPEAKAEELKLNVLRQKIGAWMSPADSFLTALKVPIDPASEPKWSAADLWETGKPGTVLIRRAAAAVGITVKSVADAADLYAVPPGVVSKDLKLEALRKTLGAWLMEKDRFLDKGKILIEPGQEGTRAAADIATDNVVLIRRAVQTVEFKVQRGGTEVGSAARLAPDAKLTEVRRLLEGHGDMAEDDAFVDAEGTDQVPLGDEPSRSLRSALKNKVLTITSRADWG